MIVHDASVWCTKEFYCPYPPADIERHKLSFVSSIKWKYYWTSYSLQTKCDTYSHAPNMHSNSHSHSNTINDRDEAPEQRPREWRRDGKRTVTLNFSVFLKYRFRLHFVSRLIISTFIRSNAWLSPAPDWCHLLNGSEFQCQYQQNMMDVFFLAIACWSTGREMMNSRQKLCLAYEQNRNQINELIDHMFKCIFNNVWWDCRRPFIYF